MFFPQVAWKSTFLPNVEYRKFPLRSATDDTYFCTRHALHTFLVRSQREDIPMFPMTDCTSGSEIRTVHAACWVVVCDKSDMWRRMSAKIDEALTAHPKSPSCGPGHNLNTTSIMFKWGYQAVTCRIWFFSWYKFGMKALLWLEGEENW